MAVPSWKWIKKEEETVTPPKKTISPPQPVISSPWQRATQRTVQPSQPEEAVLPLTKQEIMGQSAKNWAFGLHDYIQQRLILEGRKNRIIPDSQYVMQEEGTTDVGPIRGWSKGQILTGSQVIGLYENVQNQNRQASLGNLKSNSLLIKQVRGLPAGSLFYPEEQGFVVATPEAQNVLGLYKSKGYVPPGGDIGFYRSPSRPSDVLARIKGVPTSKIIIGSESMMNLGFPFLYAGVAQGLTGSPSIERQYQEYAFRGVQSLPGKDVSIESNLLSNLTSQEVIFDVYLPVAMLGVGALMKPVISPALSRVSGRLAGINTAKMIGGKYVKMSALGMTKVVGVGAMAALPVYIVGSTAVQNPEALPSVLGHLTSQAIVAGAAFKLGEMSYEVPPVIARESKWNIESPKYTGLQLQGRTFSQTLVLKDIKNPMNVYFYSRMAGADVVSTGFSSPLRITENIGGKPVSYDISITSGETSIPSGGFSRGLKELRGRNVFDFAPDGTINMRYAEGGFGTITTDIRSSPISSFSVGKVIDIEKSELVVSTYRGRTIDTSFKGFSIEKTMLGEQTYNKVGNINFIGERGLDYERVISYTKFKTGETNLDVGKIITPVMKGKEYFGEPGGFDASGLMNINKGIQDSLSLPGGGQFSSMLTRTKGYQGAFPKMAIPGKALSIVQLDELEYGIQGSQHWDGTITKQSTGLRSSSILASLNISMNVSGSLNKSLNIERIANRSITGTKSINLTSTKQLTDILSIQTVKQEQISLTMQNQTFVPLTVNVFSSVPDITNTIYPAIPFIPLGSLTGGSGGGYGSKKRRKKGSRYRVHPVELYDVLYLSKTVAI